MASSCSQGKSRVAQYSTVATIFEGLFEGSHCKGWRIQENPLGWKLQKMVIKHGNEHPMLN